MTRRLVAAVGVEATDEERRMRARATAPRPSTSPSGRRTLRASYDAVATTPTLAHAADDHRLAAQRGLVALLDRSEERIEVEVQDGRDVTHRFIMSDATVHRSPIHARGAPRRQPTLGT